ncbi:hypothetical protein AGMMS49965_04410 [Bacteroidia bacterium]|nr:hypothetical protein AGMMS49965_04410 [Bacteroidia bacterium]
MEHYHTEFSEEQYDTILPVGVENHYWVKARNRIIARTIAKCKGTGTGKILEIGCGAGLVMDYLRKQNLDCIGVDLADVVTLPSVADRIYVNKDVKDLPADICNAIDTILLLDVIEHLPDPDQFMQQLKGQFPHLKAIIITVPACPELFSNYDEFAGHFRRYDAAMMKIHANNLGVRHYSCSYFFHTLYLPARLTLRFAGKRKFMTAPKGLMKFIHQILAFGFYLDYLVFPGKWKGTSLIARCNL